MRVRLLRLSGAQGPAGGRLPHRRRQLEPGDDHDRPRIRRPHLCRAARPRRRHGRARAGAARRAAADARRPDRAQPRARAGGGRRARRAGGRADRGRIGRDPAGGGPRALPRHRAPRGLPRTGLHRRDELGRRPAGVDLPRRAQAGVHPRGPRRRDGSHRRRARQAARARPAGKPGRPGARGGVAHRLGRVRARGHARPQRQRRHRLLDREPRPDGRAHRRLGDGGAADDALRRGLPGAPRRRRCDRPRRRRRDGRREHPVRAGPRDRRAEGDRDEPPRIPLLRARVESDRLPDREGRRKACGGLHARRDPERPDGNDAGELRADARLRRRQVPAVLVREVPGGRPDARDADEVRGRGNGDRPVLQRGVPQSAAGT